MIDLFAWQSKAHTHAHTERERQRERDRETDTEIIIFFTIIIHHRCFPKCTSWIRSGTASMEPHVHKRCWHHRQCLNPLHHSAGPKAMLFPVSLSIHRHSLPAKPWGCYAGASHSLNQGRTTWWGDSAQTRVWCLCCRWNLKLSFWIIQFAVRRV